MVTIYERMPCVAAAEVDEGNRLMFPPRIVDVSLVGIVQDCQKRSGVKILPQHATRIGIVQRQRYNLPSRAITGIVRYPCYLHIGLYRISVISTMTRKNVSCDTSAISSLLSTSLT